MFLWTEDDEIINTDYIIRLGILEPTQGVFKIHVGTTEGHPCMRTYLRWGHKTHFDTKEEARSALLEIRMRLNEEK